ncbi:methyltransferase family protein [Aestuariirhabdus sp. LZHN29]|uniref:methyltransferase family protein n=1 Tax=Aestuariirhabdus sp. LZHN29 TaxID=3417462 RepID=UPI003CF96E1F
MMEPSLLNGYGASLVAFTLFGLLHSVGAQEPFKRGLARCTSRYFVDHFWRLIYCGLSYWALYYGVATIHWARNSAHDVWLVAYPEWLWQSLIVLHLGSIALLYAAFLQSDYLEFLGLKQAWRGLQGIWGKVPPEAEERPALFGSQRLEVSGVYGWVRHPMMVAGWIFLLTSGPSLNNIVYCAMYTTYMFVGGYFEERRMLRIFDDEYRQYQRRVGAFFPRFFRAPEP